MAARLPGRISYQTSPPNLQIPGLHFGLFTIATNRPSHAGEDCETHRIAPQRSVSTAYSASDLSEAIYISELRTGAAGHFSYRNVAYAMYEAVAQRYPALAKYFRVTDVREPVDLVKR